MRKFNIELFPFRKNENILYLRNICNKLKKINSYNYFVTFKTKFNILNNGFNLILNLLKDGYKVTPHISNLKYSKKIFFNIIKKYKLINIKNILLLKGDIINNKYNKKKYYKNYTNNLIIFIKKKTKNFFHIKISAYPEMHFKSSSLEEDKKYFIKKVKSGSNLAITQYFFNIDSYFFFLNEIKKTKIKISVLPGILLIKNFNQLLKFSKNCKTEISKWIFLKLNKFKKDNESCYLFFLKIIIKLCKKIYLKYKKRLHFYILNKSSFIFEIYKRFYNL